MKVERRALIFVVSLIVLAVLVAISMDRPGRGSRPSDRQTGAPSTPSSTIEPASSATPVETPRLPPGADVSGSWSGTWTSETRSDAQGGISLTWTQEGAEVGGTITMDGEVCLNGDVVRGTVNGLDLDFSVVQREASIHFSGTISGNSMSGTFSTECDIGQGTWTMQKSR